MNRMFRMLLPTTLPTAMSVWPARLALRETASSGELVPKATTVKPITNGVIRAAAASREAPRTSISPPAPKARSPARIRPMEVITIGLTFERTDRRSRRCRRPAGPALVP